jgi:hypothetical protein
VQPKGYTVGMDESPTEAASPPTCETCRFWRRQREAKYSDWGECRRMPPLLPPLEDDKLLHVGLWPHTTKADWCGEWDAADFQGGALEPSKSAPNLFSS